MSFCKKWEVLQVENGFIVKEAYLIGQVPRTWACSNLYDISTILVGILENEQRLDAFLRPIEKKSEAQKKPFEDAPNILTNSECPVCKLPAENCLGVMGYHHPHENTPDPVL